jgi:hypothetical protein
MNQLKKKTTLHIKVLENLSLTVPVLEESGRGLKTLLVAIDACTARLIQPNQEVHLISNRGDSLKVNRKSTIQSIQKGKDRVLVTI